MPDIDIFDLYQWLLAIVCTVYAVLVSARTLTGWVLWFAGDSRQRVMGRYAGVLLLRTRLSRFSGELIWIGVLSLLFLALLWAHRYAE